jgi:phosphopentomutase
VRALLLVLDSVGVGQAPDAARYGDEGANTLGHISNANLTCACRTEALGLRMVLHGESSGTFRGSFGRMRERSAGKDTTTGHWEIAGVVLEEPFATFEQFPSALVEAIEMEARIRFTGNYARSGTTVLEELGAEHLRTGNLILYTSADSVMQIAAHENVLPVTRLYEICEIARRHCDARRIARVIAGLSRANPEIFAARRAGTIFP